MLCAPGGASAGRPGSAIRSRCPGSTWLHRGSARADRRGSPGQWRRAGVDRARGMRASERDVLGERTVEEEVVLQHDPEMLAEVAQLERGEVVAVHLHAAG